MFGAILQRFMDKSPVPVMVQVLLERVLSPDKLDAWFARTAVGQYTRQLLFSTVFELMNLVVFKTFPFVNAAYRETHERIGVSIASVYNKLNGIEAATAAALVRDTANENAGIVATLGAVRQSWLPGYRIRVLDGNCIEATEHRLEVLRETKAGALPGKSLVVYDLNKATRDGETELFILTNLPKAVASAQLVADLYRKRWSIETMFQELEGHLHSEINTLGYPQAALFGFCVAVVAYNVLAVVKAALRQVHGDEAIDNELSPYYLAGNIARTYDGMMVAIASEDWTVFRSMPLIQLTEILLQLAANIDLAKFRKHRRGPKKPPPKRDQYPNQPHVSTAKLLAGRNPPR